MTVAKAESKREKLAAGQALKSCRRGLKLSQEKVASKVGCTTRYLRDIEKGRANVSPGLRRKIFEELGLDLHGEFETASNTAGAESPKGNAKAIDLVGKNTIKLPRPSPNHPFVIMCAFCNENEFARRPICRCGANLAEQVQNHRYDWEAIERPTVQARLMRLGRWAAFLSTWPLPGFACFVLLSFWGPTSEFFMTYLEAFYFPFLLSMVAAFASYFHIEHRKTRLEKYLANLNIEDFFRSPRFRSLRRIDDRA